MAAAVHDLVFLLTPAHFSDNQKITLATQRVTCLQTDDTLSYGNGAFVEKEERLSSRIECKAKTVSDPIHLLRSMEVSSHVSPTEYTFHNPSVYLNC